MQMNVGGADGDSRINARGGMGALKIREPATSASLHGNLIQGEVEG